jgi:hypothetical protein
MGLLGRLSHRFSLEITIHSSWEWEPILPDFLRPYCLLTRLPGPFYPNKQASSAVFSRAVGNSFRLRLHSPEGPPATGAILNGANDF